MTFTEALEKLGIEKYSDRILKSNSHGELFHIQDYFIIAEHLNNEDKIWFPIWFEDTVKLAKEQWERPESVFQHIAKLLLNFLESKD